MPAESKMGSAASDSPEKGGPTMPMILLSVTSWRARPGATAGSPCESNFLMVMQSLPFLSLYWTTASSAPCSMLTPRLADEPVSAPKYAISKPQFFLAVLPPPVLLLLLHAAAPATRARMAAPPSTRASPCLKASNPPPSDGIPCPAPAGLSYLEGHAEPLTVIRSAGTLSHVAVPM